MLYSKRISRAATVYILATLFGVVTLSGASAVAAPFSIESTLEFCGNLLKGNGPVDLRGLKWFEVNDALGNQSIALRADAKESKLYVRDNGTSKVEVYSESDIPYFSNLSRYFLARPLKITDETAEGIKTVEFTPSIINGRIMLSAKVDRIPTDFVVSSEHSATLTKDPVKPSQFLLQIAHLPHLSLMWKERIRLKIVPVEGELPTIEYLQYLVNDRVPVGLDGIFLHDVFTHILGYQYLAAKKEWALVKVAAKEAIQFANANPQMDEAKTKIFQRALFELIIGVEIATSQLSKTEQNNYNAGILISHLDRFKKSMSELSN